MKRIAVIISQIEESCQAHIWDGIVSAAKVQEIELVSFVAFSLDTDDQVKSHYAMFQSFITASHFDGVILFTGAMSEYTPWPKVKEYAYSINMPLVTISGNTGCGANVIINNRSGIIEQVTHLIENHQRRRIAFIGGPESNEEAAERFFAYRDALKTNRIEYDEQLIQPGNFSEESGREGIAALIENDVSFDGVICVDDYTAFGALRELNKRGIAVPRDVSLVGFDDIPEASMITPSLTTIQQPFVLLGTVAVETLMSKISNNNISTDEDSIVLNTHGVYRASCGCTSEEVRMFRENWHIERAKQGHDYLDLLLYKLDPLVAHLIMETNVHPEKIHSYRKFILSATTKLWDAFFLEVQTRTTNETVLDTLNTILNENSTFTSDFTIWQCILSNISPFAFYFDNRQDRLLAGAVLHEARIALDSREKHTIQMSAYDKAASNEAIRESCTKIIISGTQEELVKSVSEEFEEHGVQNAVLVLFNTYSPTPVNEWHLPSEIFAQLIIKDGEVFIPSTPEEQSFAAMNLVPSMLSDQFHGKNSLFMPLYMNNEYFGYYFIEVIPDAPKEIYSEFQIHISSAYKSCFMLDNLRALSMNDELTGLSNRRGFMLLTHQLHAKAINSKTNLLFFYFDLDNLKNINDNFSHDDGDRAIKGAASLLRRTFRNHDIIGRIGGDEFVAVIEESVPGLDKIMLKRLYELIETYNTHSGLPYHIEMSVGVATLQCTSLDTVETILREADRAMFVHKKERKKGRE